MTTKSNSGANLGFKNQLWAAADKRPGQLEAVIKKNLEVLGYGK